MAYDTQQEKRASISTIVGNTRIIHAVIKLAQAPVVLNILTSYRMIMEIGSWPSLQTPVSYAGVANAAIVHENNGEGGSVFVFRNTDTDWTIEGYHVLTSGTVSASTTTSATFTEVGTVNWDFSVTNRYLAKFSDGSIRAITGRSVNTISWVTALSGSPTGTVTILENTSLGSSACCPRAADAVEYETLRNLYNPYWSTPNGFVVPPANKGWNQTAIPALPSNHTLTGADWEVLRLAVLAGLTLTNTSYSSDNYPPANEDFALCCTRVERVGMYTLNARYAELLTAINNIITNNHNVNPAAIQTSTPASGLRQRVSLMINTSVTHLITATYADANTMQGLFNGGGNVGFFASVTGADNTEQTAWASLLSGIGTVWMDYTATTITGTGGTPSSLGMYDLTGSFQTLYTKSASTDGHNITYTLEGKKTSSNVLDFRVTLATSSPSAYGSTTSTFASQATLKRPSSAVLNSPVLAYPTLVSTGTM
jgi:hypothetical protein